MPLNLHEGLRKRLVEQLTVELKNATVIGGLVVSESSLNRLPFVKSIPESGPLANQLQRFVGDDPFSTFVIDELVEGFTGSKANDELSDRLSSFTGYEDLEGVANRLVGSFETLPWTYWFTVALPQQVGAIVRLLGTVELSPRHRIVGGEELKANFSLPAPTNYLSKLLGASPKTRDWDPEVAYLQISVDGYFRVRHTEPYFSVRDDLLSFFGLGIAVGLFAEAYDLFPFERDANAFVVHRQVGESWAYQSTVEIEDHYRHGIARVRLAPHLTDDAKALQEQLHRVASVYCSEQGKGVSLSSRWFFDSLCERDSLLRFVQAAVALEILLGDEDADPSIGLTALMANRCAYLIGRNQESRKNLIDLFRKFYQVRSKIVHRGKARLSKEEVRLFHSLQSVLKLVIANEQRLLQQPTPRS